MGGGDGGWGGQWTCPRPSAEAAEAERPAADETDDVKSGTGQAGEEAVHDGGSTAPAPAGVVMETEERRGGRHVLRGGEGAVRDSLGGAPRRGNARAQAAAAATAVLGAPRRT